MKTAPSIIAGLLALTTHAGIALSAEASFDCTCNLATCSDQSPVRVTFDRDRLFLKADSKNWEVSGYVTRQYSKRTGKTYLVLPPVYTGQRFVISINAGGALSLNDTSLECVALTGGSLLK